MQDRILRMTHSAGRLAKRPLAWASVLGLAGMSCAGIALSAAPAAQATPISGSTSSCEYSNSVTRPNANDVTGVTPGSTVTISCAAGSFPDSSTLVIIEASGLAAIVSPNTSLNELNEVDLGSLALPTTGADGSLNVTYTIPATYSATDSNAQCPAPQNQVNAGLTCEIIIASFSTLTPLDEAQLDYVGQGQPNRPTLHISVTHRRRENILTASDAPGACPTPVTASSHCWWGAGVTGAPANSIATIPGLQARVSGFPAANTLSVSPAIYCTTGSTAAQCAGQPNRTLVGPQLSGTITTWRSGTSSVTIDEPNTTPYRGDSFLRPLIAGTRNLEVTWFAPRRFALPRFRR